MSSRISIALITLAFLGACRSEKASVEELYTTRMLGLGYLQRNQLPEAEAEFKKLTDLAPDDPFGYANLGLTYLQSSRFADAEKELKRARELDPSSSEVGLLLAKVYAATGRASEARAELERMKRDTTSNARVLYALAELDRGARDATAAQRREASLRNILAIAPANVAVRIDLIDALSKRGEADSVIRNLEEVRRLPPELPKEARTYLDSTIQLLRAGKTPESRVTLDRFIELVKVTAPYQASLEEVKSPEGPIPGRLVLTFAPKDFATTSRAPRRAPAELVKFVDATSEAGFSAPAPSQRNATALAAGDADGDGTDDLFVSSRLYRVQGGFVRDVTQQATISLPQGGTYATFADFDNDGWLDLFVIGGDGRGYLFRNNGKGAFADVTAKAAVGAVTGARKALFADLDHDGDLDLLLVGSGQRKVFRNNLDGTFADATASIRLNALGSSAGDAVFADFDGDGRIDVAGGAAAGDYNNDGFFDLLVVAANGETSLMLNDGRGVFARDQRAAAATTGIRSPAAAEFFDYDNDGWLDLVIADVSRVHLLHNEGAGRFIDRSGLIPTSVSGGGAASLQVSDVDSDGDEDLLLVDTKGAPHLLRNDFGNSNLAVNVELKSLRTGSGKNNAFGIGARVELRAGEIYQTRVATSRITHFGLGPHLKADVLRVEWPNGVPQTVYFPGSDQDVVEREMLKGSCALAYTWDGTRFRFVTDAMWRSALGMPLGLMGGTSAYAPAGASQEYVRISGDAIKPRDGRYVLQLTEELWETAYADEVKLVAVDHPDSVDVFVDERFVPPGPLKLQLFEIAQRYVPRSAVDERGADVLSALREHDDIYVSNLTPTQYQGVVEPHDLVMDLGDAAGQPSTYLFLRGWIYPTDASINVALAQQPSVKVAPPSVEVRDASGRWRTVIPSIGFPSGKDKTIVVDLAGKFPTADHHVRLRTSMQIYWDQAFVARTLPQSASRITMLGPVSAELHYRGFSRMYRKGGRYGPYWFDYDDVTKESPWRIIEGAYTRFGDILPLLRASDDMYVIMGAGDEATIQFDATSEKSLPPGWKRDFLLYTDGWIKDSDLNTAHGTTVAPLPFHAVRAYPFTASDAYPTDAAHQDFLRKYNTRVVKRNMSRP